MVRALSAAIACWFLAATLPALDLRAEAERIDQAVDAALRTAERSPGPAIDDLTFARRVVLDLGGRIPTPTEVQAYLSEPERSRRSWLIDRIVGSEAWNSDRFIWWADLLRIQDRLAGRIPGDPYIAWLREQIAVNRPYDEMVHELIAAEGALWEPGNGAVGFHLRDQGMNEDHTAITVQAFLGTRIQCAQCHDHPDGTWTRREFMQVAAFEHGVDTRQPILAGIDRKEMRDLQRATRADEDLQRTLRRMLQVVAAGVSERRVTKKLPHDYQYDDAEPGAPVQAAPLWGAAASGDREAFAAWVTAPDNEAFDRTLANRIWADCFGRGLVEPLDDFRPDNPIADEGVLAAMAALVRRADYDLELVYRVVTRTRAYQRAAVSDPEAEGFVFAGPLSRRLAAEQIWDSLLALTVPDLDHRRGHEGADLSPFYRQVVDADGRTLLALAQRSLHSKALQQETRQRIQRARQTLRHATRQGNQAAMAEAQRDLDRALDAGEQMMMLSMSGGKLPYLRDRDPRWRGLPAQWVRASELPQPTPPNHVLRSFGQSDRETLGAASTDPTVPQALALMNGLADEMILHRRSAFTAYLAKLEHSRDLVGAIYRSVLFRDPLPAERETIREILGGRQADPGILAADLVWALVNHPQFLHQR